MTLSKAALLIGIDDYPTAPLISCVADVQAMAALLSRNEDGSPNFTCQTHAAAKGGPTMTRAKLREAVQDILSRKIDMALIYFSGHGMVSPLGGFLVTQDWTQGDEGVAMQDIVTMANDSKVGQVTIIVDACFSGKLGTAPALKADHVVLREGVAILAASSPDETALAKGNSSVFTALVCGALDGGASDVIGEVTSASIYAYAEQALGPLDQRPMYKANVARLSPLRTCSPVVAPDVLRRLPEYFPTPDYELQLDPSFEPDKTQHPKGTIPDAGKQAIFGHLQKFRAARLLVPVGEEHMFFAAIRSKSCRLTPLGKFYWKLTKEGRR